MARQLNSRHIEAFRAVMLSGTTTAAAQMLNTTQPAVSRTIAHLQSSIGVRLFDMHRGRLLPTPEAKELFDAVQRHFLGLEQIDQTVAALRLQGTGLVRIACTPVLGMAIVPKAIAAFRELYPSVRVSLHTIDTRLMKDGLLSGMYDFALSTSSLSSTGLGSEVVHQTQCVCVTSGSHPLASKEAIDVRDLAGTTLLAHFKEDTLQQRLNLLLARREISPASIIETNHSATICSLAAAGLGVGLVSPYAANAFPGSIHIARFAPAIVIQTEIAFSPHVAQSKLTLAFADAVRATLKSL